MKPISNEKRQLIINGKKRGEKEKDIAKWLEISQSSVTAIWKLYRKTGSYLPTPYPGRKPVLSAEKWAETQEFVTKNPDKTLAEIIEELALPIHKSRLNSLLIGAGFSFKKRHFTPKNS